jgi:hypothetical protein
MPREHALKEAPHMAGWMSATPVAEAIDALAQAMLRTGYVPAATQDEFHARVAADVILRELRAPRASRANPLGLD